MGPQAGRASSHSARLPALQSQGRSGEAGYLGQRGSGHRNGQNHLEVVPSLGFWTGGAPDPGPLICPFCVLSLEESTLEHWEPIGQVLCTFYISFKLTCKCFLCVELILSVEAVFLSLVFSFFVSSVALLLPFVVF